MPSSVHPEYQDQSMVDVNGQQQPTEHADGENEDVVEIGENRITVVCIYFLWSQLFMHGRVHRI